MKIKTQERLIGLIPTPIRQVLRPVLLPSYYKLMNKKNMELYYWTGVLEKGNGKFDNSVYERLMLAIAGEPDDSFLKGKVVADFGCGPQGSLAWAKSAALRIGIDLLADSYADMFTDNILSHGMIYLKSTEKVIPLPSDFVDTLFTVNALDHVDSFPDMCREIIRILKPGGELIGSVNIGGIATATEPHVLDENIIREYLLKDFDLKYCRKARRGTAGNVYDPIMEGSSDYEPGQQGFMWVRGTKKLSV
jgi:SAM-dependent methyltransferase